MEYTEQLTVGNGGWVYYQSSAAGRSVWVRFADRSDRLVPVDLLISDDGLSTELLRRIPLGRIEAWVNSPPEQSAVRRRLGTAAPDIRTAITYYADPIRRSTKPARPLPPPPTDDWRTSFDAALDWDNDDFFFSESKSQHLEVPETFNKGDDFYQSVANAYNEAVRTSHRPAVVIAERQKVPRTTAHRWIKEARRRGFLPPGRPGKAG